MTKRAPRKQKRKQGRHQQATRRPDRSIDDDTASTNDSKKQVIDESLHFEVSITRRGEEKPFWLKRVATREEAAQLADMNQQLTNRHRWDHTIGIRGIPWKVKPGDFIREGIDLGLILSSGPQTFDVIWVGGSTTRYRHGVRDIRLAEPDELEAHTCEHLTSEAKAARHERRAGAEFRRGTVSPRR